MLRPVSKAIAFTAIAYNLDDPDGWQAVRVFPQRPINLGVDLGLRRVLTELFRSGLGLVGVQVWQARRCYSVGALSAH
jgi:hypothetical protein